MRAVVEASDAEIAVLRAKLASGRERAGPSWTSSLHPTHRAALLRAIRALTISTRCCVEIAELMRQINAVTTWRRRVYREITSLQRFSH